MKKKENSRTPVSNSIVRERFPAVADAVPQWAGLVIGPAHRPIGLLVTQVVQMSVGDPRQPLEPDIAMHLERPFAQLARGGARQGAVQRIDLGQQPNIFCRIAPGKGCRRSAAPIGDVTADQKLRDAACHLGAGRPVTLDR